MIYEFVYMYVIHIIHEIYTYIYMYRLYISYIIYIYMIYDYGNARCGGAGPELRDHIHMMPAHKYDMNKSRHTGRNESRPSYGRVK